VPYVLDASVAASWCFHDETDSRADAALGRLGNDRALVPIHWWFEIRNVLLVGERRKRTSEQYTRWFLARLERLPIDLAPLPEPHAVFDLGRRHGLTFSDAAYLELARRESLALATLDGELAAAARSEGVSLLAA
jgi:predicted nucleic acid-binding protein